MLDIFTSASSNKLTKYKKKPIQKLILRKVKAIHGKSEDRKVSLSISCFAIISFQLMQLVTKIKRKTKTKLHQITSKWAGKRIYTQKQNFLIAFVLLVLEKKLHRRTSFIILINFISWRQSITPKNLYSINLKNIILFN